MFHLASDSLNLKLIMIDEPSHIGLFKIHVFIFLIYIQNTCDAIYVTILQVRKLENY